MFTPHDDARARLRAWRKFRREWDDQKTAQDVVNAFANVEIQNRFLDYYTPDSWPSVFEIVEEGWFCQSGLTLTIAATMHHLSLINEPELEFWVISSDVTGTEGLVFHLKGYCYNVLPGSILTADDARDISVVFDKHIIAADKLFR